MLLRGLVLLLAAGSLRSQQSPANKPALEFTTRGIFHEKLVAGLYQGDFGKIGMDRENLSFGLLFDAYLNAYAQRCDASLPANKVEMTKQVCAREQYTVNGFGVQVGPSTCVDWRTVGTGLYADPVLYAARKELERISAISTVGQTLRAVT